MRPLMRVLNCCAVGALFISGVTGAPGPANAQPSPARPTQAQSTDVDSTADADDSLLASAQRRRRAEQLIDQLPDADDAKRRAIEQKLAQLGDEAMVALKIAALSNDFEKRRVASTMVKRLRWRRVMNDTLRADYPDLVQTMAGEAEAARAGLVDRVVNDAPPDAMPFFRECLADRQAYVRERAVDGLVAIGEASLIARDRVRTVLENVLADRSDDNLRLLALGALSKLGVISIDKVAPLLEADSQELRRSALLALGYTNNAAAIDPILPLLEDPQWRVRAAALEALADAGPESAPRKVGQAVMERLSDPDSYVRAQAVQLLARMEYQPAAQRMLEMIEADEMDAAVGLEALARLESPEARQRILARFDNAENPEARRRWLRLLSPYRNDPAVGQRLRDVLEDSAHSAIWPLAMEMADRREDAEQYFDLIAEKLPHEDETIADAAWQEIEYYLDSRALPDEVHEALRTSDNPTFRRRALMATYMYERHRGMMREETSAELDKRLNAAVRDPATEVATLGLGMIADVVVNDAMGVEVPGSGRRAVMYGNSDKPDESKQRIKRIEPYRETLFHALEDRPAIVRTYAAAILYRALPDAPEQVKQQLAAGAKHEDTSVRVAALTGLIESPAPLAERIDLLALIKAPATRQRAMQVMASLGDPAHAEALMEAAPAASASERITTTVALVRHSTESTTAAAIEDFNALDEWDQMRVIEKLRGAAGREPARFTNAVWTDDLSDWARDRAVRTAISLKHDSAADVLKKMVTDASIDEWEKSRIRERLMEIDPEAALFALKDALMGGATHEQREAINNITDHEPTDELVAMILDAAKQAPASGVNEWAQFAAWVPPEQLKRDFLPVLNELPDALAQAMPAQLAGAVDVDDLPALLKLDIEDDVMRARFVSLIAALTLAHPERRPAIDEQPKSAQKLLLSAAGSWPDAIDVVTPHLNADDDAIAAAARRGLALHLIVAREPTLKPEYRDMLVALAKEHRGFTTYLAAEALYQHWPEALTELNVRDLDSPAAVLRRSTAAETLGNIERARIRTSLGRDKRNGMQRLAIVAAAQHLDAHLFERIDSEVAREHMDLVMPLAFAHRPDALVDHVLQWQIFTPTIAGARGLVRDLLPKRRERHDPTLLILAERGFVDGDASEMTQLVFDILEYDSGDLGKGFYADITVNSLLRALDDAPLPAITERIGKERIDEILAAITATLAWNHEPSRNLLHEYIIKDSATTQYSNESDLRQSAMAALILTARPDDVESLANLAREIEGDDWEIGQMRMQAIRRIARDDPEAARALLESLSMPRFEWQERMRFSPLALLTHADEPNWREDMLQQIGAADLSNQPQLLQTIAKAKNDEAVASVAWLPPWDERRLVTPQSSLHRFPAEPDWEELDKQARDALLGWMHLAYPPGTEQDEMQMHPFGASFPRVGVDFQSPLTQPAVFYLTSKYASLFPFPERSEMQTQRVREILSSDEKRWRLGAMRFAAWFKLDSLGDTIAEKIDAGGAESVEAAWALAWLRGESAIPAVRRARNHVTDIAHRMSLTALLTLLGDEKNATEFDHATQALLAHRIYGRLNSLELDRGGGGALARALGLSNDEEQTDPHRHTTDGWAPEALKRWAPAIAYAGGRELSARESALALPPIAPQWSRIGALQTLVHDGSANLDGLYLDLRGTLHAPRARTHELPLDPLISADFDIVPVFARRVATEQHLAPIAFVQFAGQSDSLADLRDRWRQWWRANHDKPRSAWWRQGVRQAVDELTDERWWLRARAVVRLRRLTGRPIDPPRLFDSDGWAELQTEWRDWLETDAAQSPRTCMIALARQQNVSAEAQNPANQTAANDNAAYLQLLVRLAGWGAPTASEAALVQLSTWPDGDELLRAALQWQHSPRPKLARWARRHAEPYADAPRLFYRPADLTRTRADIAIQHDDPKPSAAPQTQPANP